MPRVGIGIRWWLALAFVAISVATAALVAAVSAHQADKAVRASATDIAVGKAVNAATLAQEAVKQGRLNKTLPRIAVRRGLALYVFDGRGRRLTAKRSLGVEWAAVPQREEALLQGLRGHRFVASAGGRSSTLVALPLRRTHTARVLVAYAPQPAFSTSLSIFHREVVRAALWAIAAAAVAGLLAAWLIAIRLRRVAGAARAIEKGDFQTPLHPWFRDEIGALAVAIDRMRQRLAASFAAVSADRDRLELLLERLHEGVVTIDGRGRVEFANSVAHRLLGPVKVGSELQEPWREFSLRTFARRLFRDDARVAEARVSLDGGITYAIVGIPPARAGSGDNVVLVVTDVTERERRERAEREFVANAAHELRTPLTAITGAIEMLETGARDLPEERDRFLDHIKAESARLTRLTRALLVLARAQSDDEPLRLEPIQLLPLLQDALAPLQPPPTVALELDCPPGLAAWTERDLLTQIVTNLTANALKHTATGRVRVAARSTARAVEVEVADTGDGMAPGVRDRIFDRFFRAGDRSADGFGLGLAIVRDAVRALGATIDIETALGEGTTVRILLPAAEAVAA